MPGPSPTTIEAPSSAAPRTSRWAVPISLTLPARVDAVGARAVLARHLADARVDAERRERAREPRALVAEAVVGADDGVVERVDDVERERSAVVRGGVAAGQPQHRLVAVARAAATAAG